jgi:hypothetical protein
MPRLNQGVVPPGNPEVGIESGWHFPVGKNYTKPVITGNDLDSLAKNVLEYRANNSLRIGNPEQEITEYICTKWPHFCGGGALAAEQPLPIPASKRKIPIDPDLKPTKPMSFLERIVSWITIRWKHAGNVKFVDAHVAEKRASICSRCPMNQDWRTGCPPCVEKADRELLMIRQNRTTQQHNRLKGCRAAGHDNQTAVWLPEILLRHRRHYQLPSFCWLNELSESQKTKAAGAAQET